MGTSISKSATDATALSKEEIANFMVSILGCDYEPYCDLLTANGIDGGLLGSFDSLQEFQDDVLGELQIINKTHRHTLSQLFSKHFLNAPDKEVQPVRSSSFSSSDTCSTSASSQCSSIGSRISSTNRNRCRRVNSLTEAGRVQELKELRTSLGRRLQRSKSYNDHHCRRSPKSCQEPVAKKGKVPIVLTDIEGSTALWEADCRAMREALTLHNTIIRTVSEQHYGYEIGTEGDAFFLAFHEASDALRFGLRVQEELNSAPWADNILALPFAKEDPATGRKGLRVRVTIHMGEVQAVKNTVNGRTQYEGPGMRFTKKLESLTKGGQILTSLETWLEAVTMEPDDPCLLRAQQSALGIKEQAELCRLGITDTVIEVAPMHFNLTAASSQLLARESSFCSSSSNKVRSLPQTMLS